MGVGEEVESEDYGTVGRVFEGHDAMGGGAGLDAGEDLFDAGLRDDLVFGFWEALGRCL